MTASLTSVDFPQFSQLEPEPQLGEGTYRARIDGLRSRLTKAGLDAAIVYADREHYANISYLTGFDPRFEEALALVAVDQSDPIILAGNESLSFCEKAGVPVRGILCQSFSLPSQDRSRQRRISTALAEAGLSPGARVGVVGWKLIPREDAPGEDVALAVPQFVLSELGAHLEQPIADATGLLCGVEGMRAANEADQLALHEHRATRASQTVWRTIEALKPGRTELDVSTAGGLVGLPLACHVMCTSGSESVNGLSSPTDREIQVGDRFSTAVGYWGGLCCRAGLVSAIDGPGVEEFIERFAAPYYRAILAWYESLEIGITGGAISKSISDLLEPTPVRTLLDAGHLTHLDEWFDSPFWPGSEHELQSGMAFQCDIIPISDEFPGDAANVEDSLALADRQLRDELRDRYPECWNRTVSRRHFMTDVLGLELGDAVLPFSTRQAAFAPALLSPTQLLTVDS
ncbi:MAG: aminopeptidase P family N-terminal domain-containing protein [bacterium]